ncbi:MAG: hypothetical protein DRP87_06715 [Spirochaetes bacterium]|nr:MAG: hypothetical protein DRP87_06715 [Spirochaetota bacterium]
MIVQRDLLLSIKPFIKRDEFISIVGPRQAGKTTFLEILKKYLNEELGVKEQLIQFITFEDRRLLMEFETSPVDFINSYIPKNIVEKSYLLIDEFQYAQNGGQKLKLIYDTIKNVKIIITGSSSLDIKANVGRFMVGRIVNFYLHPFHFGEYLRAGNERLERMYYENNSRIKSYIFNGKKFEIQNKHDFMYEELIKEYEMFSVWGGYPAVVLSETEVEKRKILAEIYNNYILKDIKTLLELATEKNLFLLSQYLAAQVGNIVSYQNLSQTSGLDFRNLKKHLNILYETYICSEVRPFFRNKLKELTKNPKIYFLDMGFRNNLLENMKGLEKRPDAGAVVENTTFILLNLLFEGMNKINFWRAKAGAEVDFILNVGDAIVPVEVKYSLFGEVRLSRSLISFIESYKPERALILTKNFWGTLKRGGTHILFAPVYYL